MYHISPISNYEYHVYHTQQDIQYFAQLLLGIQYSRCEEVSLTLQTKIQCILAKLYMMPSNKNNISTLKFVFEIRTALQKDILISLPIHYSLRIYKWKWIESLDISLESLRLVCGRNIVNYPKHNLDFCVCLRRIYIYMRCIW